ncbi:MAG: NAD(+) diphosphatase [Chrysiogenales bacterium]|nr:NAD(+) diphosphatase [Candidatus Aminicenantes bacterium]TFG80300.1 MAG: NAD(+) diphosphatase [Chrysiogenales bacterium]
MNKIDCPVRLNPEPAIMNGLILPSSFTSLWDPPANVAPGGFWFIFRAGKLLVTTSAGLPDPPGIAMGERPPLPVSDRHFVGLLDGVACWVASCNDIEPPAGFVFETLRGLFNHLPDNLLAVAGRGAQVVEFHRTHCHCGVCAALTELDDFGRARRCKACGEITYPRIAPAMMVLVKRDTGHGRELLLAKGARFATIYSALAGFVEPSESVEDCVHRETFEEVGIRVCNLRYFGSQGWPFPHSLMIAFTADHESGDIACQAGEILDAQWFPTGNLPELPSRFSIARRLINAAIAEVAPDHPALRK